MDYPFKSHFYDRDGIRMHYADEGSGEAVVMVHGNPSWSYMYRGLIKALSPSYRCVAPDHVGCGLSDKPGDDRYDYTLKSRVDDLERLLEHLGLTSNLTLVLHDWGGMIGMAFASRHPERIKRLVICNTAAFLNPRGMMLPWQLKLGRDSALGTLLIRGFNAFAWGAATFGVKKPMSVETKAAYVAPYDSWANRIATLRFVQDIPLVPSDRSYGIVKDVQDGLERFRDVPMLICWGEKDFVFDAPFLAEWERRFPSAEVKRFPEAGHYVVEETGAEISDCMQRFLKQQPI